MSPYGLKSASSNNGCLSNVPPNFAEAELILFQVLKQNLYAGLLCGSKDGLSCDSRLSITFPDNNKTTKVVQKIDKIFPKALKLYIVLKAEMKQ